MSDKKLRIFVGFVSAFIVVVSIFFIRSSLTNKLINEDKINIEVIGDYNAIIYYIPANREVIISNLNAIPQKQNQSSLQKAYEIYNYFENQIPKEVFYVEVKKDDVDGIRNLISRWKINPYYLFKLIKKLLFLQSNINFIDKLTLLPIVIQTNLSDIIFTNYDEFFPLTNNMESTISVELVFSSSQRNIVNNIVEKLRKTGVDVIDKKIDKKEFKTEIVINSVDNYNKAKKVIEILNIKNKEIILKKEFIVGDLVVKIGKDYKEE